MERKSVVTFFLFIFFILGLLLGVLFLGSFMEKPLGPSLKAKAAGNAISASVQPATPPLSMAQTLLADSSQTQNQTPVPAGSQIFPQITMPVPTQKQASLPPLCGKTPLINVLAVGIDFRGDNYLYGLADVIRIVRIDFTAPTVSILTLDRNIWVEIPGISDHYGITHGLLNQAYFFGVPAMGYYDGPGGGAGLLAATLKQNFNIDVDHYAVVDMAVFVKMVDALGGIDVNLPAPVDGRPDLPFFEAGPQHLDGTQALALARIREKYTTLFRDKNQDIILRAIFAKLSSPDIIGKIPGLVQAFKNAGLTDFSPKQIEDMVCLLKKMDRTDLVFREIPDRFYVYDWIYDDYMKGNVNIWRIDFNVFRSYIAYFMNGEWPSE